MERPDAVRHELVPFTLDPDEVAEATSGKSGGWRRRRPHDRTPSRLLIVLAGVSAAILVTGVLAIAAWPGLPGRVSVVPVLAAGLAAGVAAARVIGGGRR